MNNIQRIRQLAGLNENVDPEITAYLHKREEHFMEMFAQRVAHDAIEGMKEHYEESGGKDQWGSFEEFAKSVGEDWVNEMIDVELEQIGQRVHKIVGEYISSAEQQS